MEPHDVEPFGPVSTVMSYDSLDEAVTLDDAVKLLTLPRALTASDGEEIMVANGRYGPYVSCDGLFATLPKGVTPEAVTHGVWDDAGRTQDGLHFLQ